MAQYQEAAIVLKSRPYREADSLLTIFGQTHGKTGAVAKGVRKPKSKLQAGLYPLSYTMLQLYQGRSSLATVVGAELVQGFGKMRNDLGALSWGMFLADVVDALWTDHDASSQTFQWLVVGLDALNQGRSPATVGMTIAWRCLELAGYSPGWDACAICEQSTERQGPVGLLLDQGQALCSNCHVGHETFKISLGSLKTWRQWMQLDSSRLGAVEAHGLVYRELFEVLSRYFEVQIGRRPRSLEFLESLAVLPDRE